MSQYTKSTNFATKDNLSPGDPLKIVRGTEIDTEFNNISTAISTKTDNSAAAITGGSITGITDLAVADGGTGASTATAAINNLLPAQTSAANKYLQSDGTNVSWDAVTLSTSDITGTLAVANGGTGVTSSTGTGNVVLSNSPTLVTPALGTPASGVATNITGLPISTGVSGLGTGVATFLGTPSSANLISAVTDETGTGSLVFATSPTLVTPALGTPSALVGTNITGTASGLTAGNVTTNANLTGAVTSVGNATSLGSFTSSQLATALTDETGSGANVFATSPTLVTPILGTPTSGVATNLTGLPLTTGVTGTLPTANGGTNLTSFTSGGVVYASSSSVLATGSALTFNGSSLSSTGGATFQGSQSGFGGGEVRLGSTTADLQNAISTQSTGTPNLIFDHRGASNTGTFLWRNGSNGANELMRLTSTGLGIGTTSPAYKLSVVTTGNSFSIGATTTATSYNLALINNAGGSLYLGVDNLVGSAFSGAAYGSIIGTSNATSLQFITNNTVRANLDSSGNLGLGVTPSAWNTFSSVVQGNGYTLSGYGVANNTQVFLSNNAYYNTGWKYTLSSTGGAAQYGMYLNEHRWFTAPSGTAGNAITFTQAMTLDASGNLLVGSTSAVNGAAGRGYVQINGSSNSLLQFTVGSANKAYIYCDGTNLDINNQANGYMTFQTNATERARITSGGYSKFSNAGTYQSSTGSYHELRSSTIDNEVVYISHTNATNPIGVTVKYTVASPNGTGNSFVYCADSTAVRADIRSNGGIANYSANNVNLSDQRVKTDIQDAGGYLAKICAIPVRTFKYKDQTDDLLNLGVIAQEVEAVAPELVDVIGFGETPEDGVPLKAIYQTDLQYALMKCIQEQQAIIESLKARLDAANL